MTNMKSEKNTNKHWTCPNCWNSFTCKKAPINTPTCKCGFSLITNEEFHRRLFIAKILIKWGVI